MKPAYAMTQQAEFAYEAAYAPDLIERVDVRYDNRAYAMRSYAFWASAWNEPTKHVPVDGVPDNEAGRLLVEGYAGPFMR